MAQVSHSKCFEVKTADEVQMTRLKMANIAILALLAYAVAAEAKRFPASSLETIMKLKGKSKFLKSFGKQYQ